MWMVIMQLFEGLTGVQTEVLYEEGFCLLMPLASGKQHPVSLGL